jgi:hypothetical protein
MSDKIKITPSSSDDAHVLRMVEKNGVKTPVFLLDAGGLDAESIAKGLPMQSINDTNRSRVVATFTGTSAVADTLLNITKITSGLAATAAATVRPTSGKTLRLNGIHFSVRSGALLAVNATLNFRTVSTGNVVLASPSEFRIDLGNAVVALGVTAQYNLSFSEGMEFTGTQGFGISLSSSAVSNIHSISIYGYEY